MESKYKALLAVAEAAAVLFRPPYRPFAGIAVGTDERRRQEDLRRLYEALVADDCPVEIGEEWT